MTAALITFPDVRVITVRDLPIAERVAEIETMASATGLTEHATLTWLRTVAHESLAGPALLAAWHEAKTAIACRDATDPADCDYPGYADRAADAICDLIHGNSGGGTGS